MEAHFSQFQRSDTYVDILHTSPQDCELNALIKHALTALKETSQNGDINSVNSCVAVVGEGMPFTIYDGESVQPYIDLLDKDAVAEEAPQAMQE